MAPQRPLRAGVYAPVITAFGPDEELDLATQRRHAVRLAQAGLVGLVALGSNGEAVHVNDGERVQVIRAMREALSAAGFDQVPVIAGCSAQSVRGCVELATAAQAAGADYAMVLPPCYYRPAMTPAVLKDFFIAVAERSPLPILMYNYPGAVAGVDLDSDTMREIVDAARPNVVGAKFTCANTGKLARVACSTVCISAANPHGMFLAAGGMADMIPQTAVVGGSGVIAGSANVFPRACVRLWDLCTREGGKQLRDRETLDLQRCVAEADAQLGKNVVPSVKAALGHYYGYGGPPRRPLKALEAWASFIDLDDRIPTVMEIEKSLERQSMTDNEAGRNQHTE